MPGIDQTKLNTRGHWKFFDAQQTDGNVPLISFGANIKSNMCGIQMKWKFKNRGRDRETNNVVRMSQTEKYTNYSSHNVINAFGILFCFDSFFSFLFTRHVSSSVHRP